MELQKSVLEQTEDMYLRLVTFVRDVMENAIIVPKGENANELIENAEIHFECAIKNILKGELGERAEKIRNEHDLRMLLAENNIKQKS